MANKELTVQQPIENLIYEIRGQKVMLDRDLAMLYGVETRVLNQAVKRNAERFPDDFMFQLTENEVFIMSSQIVITSNKRPKKALPYAFTEQGISMLSAVLRSRIAIEMSIKIMRAFVSMRKQLNILANTNMQIENLRLELQNQRLYIEEILHDVNDTHDMDNHRMDGLEKQLDAVNDALAQLSSANSQQFLNNERTRIKGFKADD
ncbi:MAG: ORF6N domain-containing protein [Prevotella sp.]|nr:ORF6N domain-containing protein [Candidatus Prevotella equi]